MLAGSLAILLSFSAALTMAAPVKEEKRSGVTSVSASVEASFTPHAHFASAAYCTGGSSTWNCGSTCSANADFVQYAGGGDDDATPYWFVGWSPSLNSIIIGHEGTDPTQFLSDLTDAEIATTTLPTSLFPGISQSIYVHSGFLGAFENSAAAIYNAVNTIMAAHSTTSLTVVGHSLGGAIANIEGVSLKLRIPALTVKIVTFGEPRVGNQAWADYLNGYSLTRITHDYDPIPIVPGRFLGFVHPDGEIHIEDNNAWMACAGEDNTDPQCSTGAVPNIFESDIIDHLGPYNGVWMGTIYC